MNYLFFDTETTGLPMNWNAPMTDLNNWPRVIQLAWILTDDLGIEMGHGKYLIEPNGWTMPTAPFWIENGFDHIHSLLNGFDIKTVLGLFLHDFMKSDCLVSHNMAFDKNVLGAEMIRAGMKGKKVQNICTKVQSTEFCKLPAARISYGYKWPKLSELHQKLFNCGFDGAHDAMADVMALKDCFFELERLGIIKTDNNKITS